MGEASAVGWRAAVSGRAGTGFAGAVVERARSLGVLGWVREDDDGVVRVHAEGKSDAVMSLRSFLEEGGAGSVDITPGKVEGHEQFAVRGVPAGAFVVRERGGRYELWLEVDGAVRAWALPKEPSVDPAVRRLAIEVEGDAGGDAVEWDRGAYEQGGRVAWPEALDRGHAVFVLHGEKLRGGFVLQRTRERQWLLLKRR